ncbi:hypothetical protein BV898_16821 [Hypsibius exemplaris]|uniref:Uncharacterized protein n=1 Tax=Hypsibius exemplaris TaxID=2072580 RepID=A0A9X6NGT0_HYPEX|nr:hypothetical protein BV898_16821 [Hypsibius exemplaris]
MWKTSYGAPPPSHGSTSAPLAASRHCTMRPVGPASSRRRDADVRCFRLAAISDIFHVGQHEEMGRSPEPGRSRPAQDKRAPRPRIPCSKAKITSIISTIYL